MTIATLVMLVLGTQMLPPPPDGSPTIPAAPHAYYMGGNAHLCNCPGERHDTETYWGYGPTGYHLFADGNYSYTYSQPVTGTYAVPLGKRVVLEWWLVNTPVPTSAGYYSFGSTLTSRVAEVKNCPKAEPDAIRAPEGPSGSGRL